MFIGDKLKGLREHKNFSQGDIEKRTGLLRCYISRVENGHTTPAVETLEKFARALGVPMYQLFYEGEDPPALNTAKALETGWGSVGNDAKILGRFRRLFGRVEASDVKLLLFMAQKMAQKTKTKKHDG
jgi:transcriptional regulator with XRE-family HTH domain